MYQSFAKKFSQTGEVTEINFPVVGVRGLPDAFFKEYVYFENGERGVILNLKKELAEVLLLGATGVKMGEKVAKSGEPLKIPVSISALGKIITPFGSEILGPYSKDPKVEFRSVDTAPPGLETRRPIRSPLICGIPAVDTLFPLGKGQRELVVGNRKTGKTTFLTSLLKGVAGDKTVVIYNLIASQKKEAFEIYEYAVSSHLSKFLIIASFAGESSAMVYFSPFCAMTYAEYFRDAGYDVVLVLDDMTTHAKYCREISLLARGLPGRDSYPPDIFYTHARILERAGNFSAGKKGQVSITCLPVAQTKENDFTDYIVSNLIGITDGHLLFDEDEFSKGRRPAINYSLSVTRVGRQVQNALLGDVGRRALSFLTSEYAKSQTLSYFGSELTDYVRDNLDKGEKLEDFFNQSGTVLIPCEVQVVMCAMILNGYFKGETLIKMQFFKEVFVKNYLGDGRTSKMVNNIASVKDFEHLTNALLDNKLDLLESCKKAKT